MFFVFVYLSIVERLPLDCTYACSCHFYKCHKNVLEDTIKYLGKVREYSVVGDTPLHGCFFLMLTASPLKKHALKVGKCWCIRVCRCVCMRVGVGVRVQKFVACLCMGGGLGVRMCVHICVCVVHAFYCMIVRACGCVCMCTCRCQSPFLVTVWLAFACVFLRTCACVLLGVIFSHLFVWCVGWCVYV